MPKVSYKERCMPKVSYSEDAVSTVKWDHVDGPMFIGKDGYIHWLTLWERLGFWCGILSIKDLERKHRYLRLPRTH